MSENIEVHIFGQIFKLSCPKEKQEALKTAVHTLEGKVDELKERTGILNLEKLLSIIALNLTYELAEEKEKTDQYTSSINASIEQMISSLDNVAKPSSTNNHH